MTTRRIASDLWQFVERRELDEAVTSRENSLRGDTIAARNAASTTCPRGHTYDIQLKGGGRWCSICRRSRALSTDPANGCPGNTADLKANDVLMRGAA